MRLFSFATAVVVLLASLGCGSGGDSSATTGKTPPTEQGEVAKRPTPATLAGHYVAEVKAGEAKPDGDAAKGMAEGMAAAMVDGSTLDLNEDGTFAMEMVLPYEGKYTLEGERITLVVETVAGVSKDDPQAKGLKVNDVMLDVQEDGSLKGVPQEGAENIEMVFRRAAKE